MYDSATVVMILLDSSWFIVTRLSPLWIVLRKLANNIMDRFRIIYCNGTKIWINKLQMFHRSAKFQLKCIYKTCTTLWWKSGHNILTQMFEGRREMEEVTFVAVSCNPQPCKPLNRSWFFSVIVAPCCFSCRVVLYGNKQESGNVREYT